MTLEIIVFILAILFGIIIYWREAKNNKLYRFFNKMMHSKELQMKPESKKGFVCLQPFLIRLVWVALLFVLTSIIISLATPINAFYVEYFVAAIVGTLIGTYIASAVIFTNKSLKKESFEKVYNKGKDFIEDLTDGDEEATKPEEEATETTAPEEEEKSARERMKDKGFIK